MKNTKLQIFAIDSIWLVGLVGQKMKTEAINTGEGERREEIEYSATIYSTPLQFSPHIFLTSV